MSRSRRYRPVFSLTTCKSEKDDKRIANRRLRRRVNEQVRRGECDVLPIMDEVYNQWNGGKDGRCKFWVVRELDDHGRRWLAKGMRK